MVLNDCTIEIELDEREPILSSDQPLTGTVYVEVGDDCRCDGLVLTSEWRTRSDVKANRDGETDAEVELFRGEWSAGERHAYSFELDLPPGPYTYEGHHLNVVRRLEVRADIPWAIDPRAEREWTYRPGPEASDYVPGPRKYAAVRHGSTDDAWMDVQDEDDDVESLVFYGELAIGAASILVGLVVGAFVVFDPWFDGVLTTLGCLAFGGYMLFQGLRNHVAEMRLGDVDVALGATELRPGDTVECRVNICPEERADVNEVSIQLHGYEHVTHTRGGTNRKKRTIHEHTVCQREHVLEGDRHVTIEGGTERTFTGELQVPESAPRSFCAPSNELIWKMTVRVDVPDWPDWVEETSILVRPPIREDEQRAEPSVHPVEPDEPTDPTFGEQSPSIEW
jgi:sporulation-control protein spo0M